VNSTTGGIFTGGCACGKVRYRGKGPALFGLICCCLDCQKASGTGHVPIMGIARSGFEAVGPVVQHRVPGGSGDMAVRNFCGECHSLLFGTPEVAPDLVTIYVGSLGDSSHFVPQKVQFTRYRRPWDTCGAGLPSYEGAAP
jgi:hypothetical protein